MWMLEDLVAASSRTEKSAQFGGSDLVDNEVFFFPQEPDYRVRSQTDRLSQLEDPGRSSTNRVYRGSGINPVSLPYQEDPISPVRDSFLLHREAEY